MKIQDCYIGQKVGFSYEGETYISKVKNIEHVPLNKDTPEKWVAVLDNGKGEVHEINVRRLLGVL